VEFFPWNLCERRVATKLGYPVTSTTMFLCIDSGFLCLHVSNGSAAFTRVYRPVFSHSLVNKGCTWVVKN